MKENNSSHEISTNITNEQNQPIYQKEYKTINSTKMLESIREVFSSQNYSLSKLYLFLLKLSNQNNYFGIKLQTVYYQSEIALKENNILESIRLGHKIITWINSLDIKKYNADVVSILIRVLLNSSEVCQDSNPILSCWFLFAAKNIFMKYPNKNSALNDEIKTKFPFVIKKLSNQLEEIKYDVKDKKVSLIKLGKDMNNILEQYEKDREKYLKEIKSEKIFIVNKKWIKDFIAFSDILCKENIDFNSLFQTNPLCLMYFSQNNEEQEETKGIYCGEANNFLFIKPKLYWPDDLQKYTNVFLDKEKFINKDNFIILDEEIFTRLKFFMGINYEIERIKDKKYSIDKNINLYEFKIIFLNEEMRDKGKENIILKYMQINENDDINNLIEKIKRGFIGFLNENKYDISEYDYKIYLCDYNRQNIIDIILFYTNLLEHFKIKGIQINSNEFLSNNKNISIIELFKDTSTPKFICCEAIDKNSIVIPFLVKYDPNKLSCATCNVTCNLNSEKIIYCKFCPHVIYCSEKCKNEDDVHRDYHQKISKFYETSLKLSEPDIETISIKSFLDKNSRKGLTGLINIGESDFILSIIQALSCCEIFIKYILTQSHKYLNDKYTAKDNTSLVACYSELVYQMWVGSNKEINPSKFKDLFFNQIFKNNNNNRSLDILDIFLLLLDKLHLELNTNKNKNDEEEPDYYPQQIGESDGQAALRWWKLHKEFNNSIVSDLFQGQLKLKICCPICKWGYVTYPPFYFLNLPLPNKDEMSKITFRVFPYSINDFNYVEISFYNINKFTSVSEIKKKIKQYKMFNKSNLDAVLFENNELVEILEDDTLIYDYVYPRYDFSDEYFIDYEISFIEKPENKREEINLYVTPIVFEEDKGWFYTSKNIVSITYCKLFSLNKDATIKDLQKEIFKYYRKAIDDKYKENEDDSIDDSYYIEFYQKLNDEKYIEEEYNKFIAENGNMEIYIYHNLPKNSSWIFSGTNCEFCGYSSKTKFCKLDVSQNDKKMSELINKMSNKRTLFLLVNFKKYEHMFKNFYTSYIDEKDPHMCLAQDITIYDCLDIYSLEKKLIGEKNFICSRCGRNVVPNQIKYPYSPPKYLILGLKRIKKKFEDITEMINNAKDDRMVGYPLENFDASPYFINKSKKYAYNLKSVILHVGTIKKCKYKAIIKNNDNWYEIDDINIKEVDKDYVINQNAYILINEKTGNDIDENDNEEKVEDKNDIVNREEKIDSINEVNRGKRHKKFREEEELLNNEEMFGIKTFGQIEDI